MILNSLGTNVFFRPALFDIQKEMKCNVCVRYYKISYYYRSLYWENIIYVESMLIFFFHNTNKTKFNRWKNPNNQSEYIVSYSTSACEHGFYFIVRIAFTLDLYCSGLKFEWNESMHKRNEKEKKRIEKVHYKTDTFFVPLGTKITILLYNIKNTRRKENMIREM